MQHLSFWYLSFTMVRGCRSPRAFVSVMQASLMQKLQRPGEAAAGGQMSAGTNANGYGPGINANQAMPGGMQSTAGMGGGAAARGSAPAAVKQERTILLRNMFAPEEAKADEDFEEEMKEDIAGECAKYGRIEHVKVDKVRLGRNLAPHLVRHLLRPSSAGQYVWMSDCVHACTPATPTQPTPATQSQPTHHPTPGTRFRTFTFRRLCLSWWASQSRT